MQRSVSQKLWYPVKIQEDLVSIISRKLQVSDFLARLVSTRISSVEEAYDFLNPKIKNCLPDPFHLLDMHKGVERMVKAIQNKEKLCIFADYDVDGATSSALLKNVFRELNIEVEIYVPNRVEEGYGPTLHAMKKIKNNDNKVVITVDCGSVAFEALLYAAEIGLDVIVIDHHISLDILPKAVAVINPNRADESSNYKNLAAVGICFLFAVAVCLTLRKRGFFDDKCIQQPDLMKQLDIVALGTVCDVMTLTGLNRAFVKQGLKVAKARGNLGYSILCDTLGLNEPINCYHLGFVIGPRINAGGRVGNSSLGAELLSTKDFQEAKKISKELNIYNDSRKILELSILEEAHKLAKMQANNAVICISANGWHLGIIGIIATRIKDIYNKPVTVITLNNSIGKGSCRSIKGFNFGLVLMEAKLKGILVSSGGHAMAGGFTIKEKKLPMLHEFLENAYKSIKEKSTSELEKTYDLELTPNSINYNLLEEINKLAPFGNGNRSPIFKFNNLFVLRADIIGLNHIRVLFASSINNSLPRINSIAFNSVNTDLADILLSKKSYNLSVIGTLRKNKWQDNEVIQLEIKDLIIISSSFVKTF